jgi:hypothetical protein
VFQDVNISEAREKNPNWIYVAVARYETSYQLPTDLSTSTPKELATREKVDINTDTVGIRISIAIFRNNVSTRRSSDFSQPYTLRRPMNGC